MVGVWIRYLGFGLGNGRVRRSLRYLASVVYLFVRCSVIICGYLGRGYFRDIPVNRYIVLIIDPGFPNLRLIGKGDVEHVAFIVSES